MTTNAEHGFIIVGRITGAHGVRGWVKLRSHTEPMDNILTYQPWFLHLNGAWQPFTVEDGRIQGKAMAVQLEGIADRDAALALRGIEIAVQREQLPPATDDEYYWIDLIGLRVVNLQGQELGRVDHLLETGANDVLVVQGERERLIPFVQDLYVMAVSLQDGVIAVDWDADD